MHLSTGFRVSACRVLLGGAVAALSSPVWADYSASVLARASGSIAVINGPNGSDSPADKTVTGATTLLSIGNDALKEAIELQYTAYGSAHATATVQPGLIQLNVLGAGGSNVSPPNYWQADNAGYARADGSFSDSLVWSVQGMAAGSLVNLKLSFNLQSPPSVTRNAVAGGWAQGQMDYQWGFGLSSPGWGAGGGYATGIRSYGVGADGAVSFNTFAEGTQVFDVTVMLGTPTGLSIWSWVQAYGRAGTPYCVSCVSQMDGQGTASLQSALSWGGVLGVTDANGAPIPLQSLGVISSSGFNYVSGAPVPEPSTWWMLAAGLGLLTITRPSRSGRSAGCVTEAGSRQP